MDSLSIRSLQHYLYCPHRWGLMEIDRAWAENYFVVKANHIHDRAHSGDSYALRGKKVYTDVYVWNDELGLVGKTDCIEERKDGLCIVEYKPTKPGSGDIRHEDAMQLFAQKLCAEQVFGRPCATEIYYADVKKRVKVSFADNGEEYKAELKSIIAQMREYLDRGLVPPVRKEQNCGGCSMRDLCMPGVLKRQKRERLKSIIKRECDSDE